MNAPIEINFDQLSPETISQLSSATEQIIVCLPDTKQVRKKVDSFKLDFTQKLSEYISSKSFSKLKENQVLTINFPESLATDRLLILKLPAKSNPTQLREAGGAIGANASEQLSKILIFSSDAEYFAEGIALRGYSFNRYKKPKKEKQVTPKQADIICLDAELSAKKYRHLACGVAGTFFTRDLVNEPANSLTTTEFASQLKDLEKHGVEVEVLEEQELAALGMNTLLAVGQASQSPSKVVTMKWKGQKGKPYAIIGKGVCFDTGGISLKPPKGMEKMTMDMAGAGVVAGVMKALAMAQSPVHVVGIVGLVENMPGGNAMRPGDIVKSLKGDTVEILNTDAEGRLVLADLLWHTQETHNPQWMINLATLTGAIMVSLGDKYAGLFSNNDELTQKFFISAGHTGEKAWRQPLDEAFDKQLDSRLADMKNIGGMYAGAITAAQFLKRFVKSTTPWIHLDIAGVAFPEKPDSLAPVGPSGWGVRTIFNLLNDGKNPLE